MKTQFLFRGWLRFLLASLGRGVLLLGTVLLSLSSLIYAAEQGEYRHYLGLGVSGGLFYDGFQQISTASDDTSDDTVSPNPISSDYQERGGFYVWDRFILDNQAAFSLMILVANESTRDVYSGGSIYDGWVGVGGPLATGKYFISNSFYVGGGIALLSIGGHASFRDRDISLTSVPFSASTLIFGYRGLVSEFEKSHFYIGVDWINTLPVDVDYEFVGQVSGFDTFKDLSISMLAVSFGFAW